MSEKLYAHIANQRIAELERELAEARKDAERYRWLRINVLWSYPSAEGSDADDAYLTVTGHWDEYHKLKRGSYDANRAVDAAVDAARKAVK